MRIAVIMFGTLFSIFGIGKLGHPQWQPKETDRPEDVYVSAKDDLKDRRFQEALQKLSWLFETAHIIEPSFESVRLSYVVADWVDLARGFAPAHRVLEQAKEIAQHKSADQKLDTATRIRAFREFAAICKYQECEKLVVKHFEVHALVDAEYAAQVIRYARRQLYADGKLSLLQQFVKPAEQFAESEAMFEKAITQFKDKPTVRASFQTSFIEDAEMCIAIAMASNDQTLADEIAARSCILIDDAEIQKRLRNLTIKK